MSRKYQIGSGSKCVAGIQSAYGTAQTTPTALLNMRSESISVTVTKTAEDNLFENKVTGGVDLDGVSVGGSVSTYLRPEFADWLFEATLGKKTGNVYTLADPDDDIVFSTVYLERGSECKKYADMAVSSLSISANAQKTVEANINFIGCKEEDDVMPNNVSDYVKKSYKCTNAYLKYGAGNGTPSVSLPVETLTLSIDNGLSEGPRTYLSTIYSDEPSRGIRSVSIQFTLPKGSDYDTLKDTYLEANSYVAFELQFSNGTTGETVTVKLPNVSLTAGSANVNGPGMIDGSLSGIAVQVGNAEPITITVSHASEAHASEA